MLDFKDAEWFDIARGQMWLVCLWMTDLLPIQRRVWEDCPLQATVHILLHKGPSFQHSEVPRQLSSCQLTEKTHHSKSYGTFSNACKLICTFLQPNQVYRHWKNSFPWKHLLFSSEMWIKYECVSPARLPWSQISRGFVFLSSASSPVMFSVEM